MTGERRELGLLAVTWEGPDRTWSVDVVGLTKENWPELVAALDAAGEQIDAAVARFADPVWLDGFTAACRAAVRREMRR